jgi:hypothetical protein
MRPFCTEDLITAIHDDIKHASSRLELPALTAVRASMLAEAQQQQQQSSNGTSSSDTHTTDTVAAAGAAANGDSSSSSSNSSAAAPDVAVAADPH